MASQLASSANPAGVEAPLTFIIPQDEKPVFKSAALTGGEPEVFFDMEERTVRIADMRAMPEPASLEREGFELHEIPTSVDLYDDDAVQKDYYREIEDLLKKRFGAGRVAIFDATRRSDGGAGADNPDGKRGPAVRVHVDYTVDSAPQRLKDVVGEAEGQRLLESGAQIIQINVWRPMRGPVLRAPLAVADATTVNGSELIATDQVFPDRVGEIYQLAHAPGQKWYFAPRMTRDEILLIKGWDSLDHTGAHYTPHGAFQLPDTTPDTPPRESIEVRTFVIIEN